MWQRTRRQLLRVQCGPPFEQVSTVSFNAPTYGNVSCSDFPLLLDLLDEQHSAQVGNPVDIGRFVFSEIPDTEVITAVAAFSTVCKFDEAIPKPCSLGLSRMEPPGGIGGRATVLGTVLSPLSLGGFQRAAPVVAIDGNCPMLIPVGLLRTLGAVVLRDCR